MIPCAIMLLGFAALKVLSQSNGEKTVSDAQIIEKAQLPKIREIENMTEIIDKMFQDYDKRKRPYFGGEPVNVSLVLGVISVSHISEENMEFKADMYFRQIWDDPRLAFGTDRHSILLQREEVNKLWLPDTYIENTRKIEIDEATPSITIFGSGKVFYSYKAFITLASQMQFRQYPMDRQGLTFNIMSYAYDGSRLILKWEDSSFMQKEMAAFNFESLTFTTTKKTFLTGTYIELVLTVHIKRRLGYFLLQFYFPCIICTVISWVPFWMDRYSIGDRLSLAITTLLTEVFLSESINSSMPRVNYIKAADGFTLASFIFIFFALFENVIVYLVRKDVRMAKEKRNSILKVKSVYINDVASNDISGIPQEDAVAHAGKSAPQNNEQLDLSLRVDKFSRVCFPLSYIIFASVYWVTGLNG